ncbi:tyrosine-protein kinase Src-1-like isoform X2 [Pyxicephalus adspersus]|uniref:tyrosine-protein kinase Src-1-like isoform X2 n=1 Tax=Pyxicephalus adspersus TaxID=30357 RepID=UPI003B5AA5BD
MNTQVNRLSDKYVSIKNFKATVENEITVKPGERFQVLSMEKDRWLVSKVQVTKQGDTEIGYVPCGHLVKEKSVEKQSWFTELDDVKAEDLLLSEPNMDGSFLVRPSKDSQYCLSVRKNKEVIHYIIKNKGIGKCFIFEEKLFTCIHDLVHYYRYHLNDHNRLPLTPFLNVPSQRVELSSSNFILVKKVSSYQTKTSNSRICLWEGNWTDGGKKVLILTIPKEFFRSNNFMDGIEVQKTLNHKNIAKLYELCTAQDPVYIVTEFMEKGDLSTFLRCKTGLDLVETELMYIAHQVADAMAYLEVKRVFHLDLACRNILVGNNLLCKISQFGLCIQKKQGEQPFKDTVPIKWMPLEVLQYGNFTNKTDVWCFGIVLYEIFTLGQYPYAGLSAKESTTKLVEGYRLPMPPLCTYDVYTLMLQCWHKDINQRPSFQKIVESKIFENYNTFGLSDKYVSVKDYQATGEDEISIKAKERFEVQSVEKDRFLVSKMEVTEEDSMMGYVPCDYLIREKPVEKQSWFIDTESEGAETLLLSEPNTDGSFLVRPSQESHYCLSVRKNKAVINYSIKREDTGRFFIYKDKSFTCVHDLVQYYQHHLKDQNRLPLTPFFNDYSHVEENWERPSLDFTLEEKMSLHSTNIETCLWKGKWIEGRRKVHIQTVSKELFERANFMHGIEILKNLNHKNIIHLYALCTSNDPVYIITEFMQKGHLLSVLRGDEGTLLTESELLHIAHQVADGMAYLEVKRVKHLDLTCRNIMVGDNLVCKISQFGFAKQKEWMPPEVLKGGIFTTKTDVWSFGIVLYEIFTLGQTPYATLKGLEEVRTKVTEGYRLPKPPLCTSDVYSLMLKCWHQDLDSRPSFQEIVESKIFTVSSP